MSSTGVVDFHSKLNTLETIQTELKLHPWRLEEKRGRTQKHDDDFENTPLMTAAKAGNYAVVVFLLSLGANVEAKRHV